MNLYKFNVKNIKNGNLMTLLNVRFSKFQNINFFFVQKIYFMQNLNSTLWIKNQFGNQLGCAAVALTIINQP